MSRPADAPAAGRFVRVGAMPLSDRQRRASLAAALILIAAGVFTLHGFLAPLAWAAIFAIGLWPSYQRVVRRWPRHDRALLPGLFTLIVLVGFVVPVVLIAVPLVSDASSAIAWIDQARQSGVPVPDFVNHLPFHDRLVPVWQRELGEPGQFSATLAHVTRGGIVKLVKPVAQVARWLIMIFFMLLTLFFLLRDGEFLVGELRIGSRRAFGASGEDVGEQIVRSVRGTIDGLVLVGLGVGVLLGIADWGFGVPHPALIGLLTALLAMVPFGASVAIGVSGAILLVTGGTGAAIALVVLGSIIVFIADHFIRPVLIGGTTRLPFLWVLLGILGGVESWGLVGLFVGPAVMAALVLLWREWVGAQEGPLNPPADALEP